jgi:hypothetical protein
VHSFETLWKSINGEESWNVNPWVWAVSFKVLTTDGKPEQDLSNNIPQTTDQNIPS